MWGLLGALAILRKLRYWLKRLLRWLHLRHPAQSVGSFFTQGQLVARNMLQQQSTLTSCLVFVSCNVLMLLEGYYLGATRC